MLIMALLFINRLDLFHRVPSDSSMMSSSSFDNTFCKSVKLKGSTDEPSNLDDVDPEPESPESAVRYLFLIDKKNPKTHKSSK